MYKHKQIHKHKKWFGKNQAKAAVTQQPLCRKILNIFCLSMFKFPSKKITIYF